MTCEEFQNDENRRTKLEKLLKDPVLKYAFEALKDELEPRDDLPVTLANPTVAAHRYHQHAGANHIIKGLRRLTQPFKTIKAPQGRKLRTEVP